MATDRLVELEERVRQDLAWLDLPARAWVPEYTPASKPTDVPLLDVAIIGGGMSGLSIASYLKLRGVARTQIFDQNPAGFEGPWETFARMETLRTVKEANGPANGIPSLTPRAWYEARFGVDAWRNIQYITRSDWMDYLRWYRKILRLPVRNESKLMDIQPLPSGHMVLTLETKEKIERVEARRLVLATGFGGSGQHQIPQVAKGIPRRLWAHSDEPIDFKTLAGKRVGIVGAGASSIDNASTALEHDAKSVDIFVRRKFVPHTQHVRAVLHVGGLTGFKSMPPEDRYKFWDFLDSHQNPPPRHSLLRLNKAGPYQLHLDSLVLSLESNGDALQIRTKAGIREVDFLIFGTGFAVDLSLRSELTRLREHIAMVEVNDETHPRPTTKYSTHPIIEMDYRFRERNPGKVSALRNIYCVTDAAILTHAGSSVSCIGLPIMASTVGQSIIASLFVEDRDKHLTAMRQYNEPEFTASEWH